MYYKAAHRLPFFHIFSYFIFRVNDKKHQLYAKFRFIFGYQAVKIH